MFADNCDQDDRIMLMSACVICAHNLTNYLIHYDFDSLPEVYLVTYTIEGLRI